MPDFISSLEGAFDLENGPLVDIEVAVNQTREDALRGAGKRVPDPVQTKAFLDTGSTGTAIDFKLAERLSLPAVDYMPYRTPGGRKFAPTCRPKLLLPMT